MLFVVPCVFVVVCCLLCVVVVFLSMQYCRSWCLVCLTCVACCLRFGIWSFVVVRGLFVVGC